MYGRFSTDRKPLWSPGTVSFILPQKARSTVTSTKSCTQRVKKFNVIESCGLPSRKNSHCDSQEGRLSFETSGKEKRGECKEVAVFLQRGWDF